MNKPDFSIKFDLNQRNDPLCDNVVVFITLPMLPDPEYSLSVTVGTPAFQEKLLGDRSYLEPGKPWILVSKLTSEIIYAAIEAYTINGAYWLLLLHSCHKIDRKVFLELLNKENKSIYNFVEDVAIFGPDGRSESD